MLFFVGWKKLEENRDVSNLSRKKKNTFSLKKLYIYLILFRGSSKKGSNNIKTSIKKTPTVLWTHFQNTQPKQNDFCDFLVALS